MTTKIDRFDRFDHAITRARAERAQGRMLDGSKYVSLDQRIRVALEGSHVLREPIAYDGWGDGCTADDYGRG